MSAISHKRTFVFPIPPPGKTNGVCLGRRRWLRRRPPAAPRGTGAGAGPIGSWPGPVGAWRGPRLSVAGSQPVPFEFSDRSQGHTRLQARGGGSVRGYPPLSPFSRTGTHPEKRSTAGWPGSPAPERARFDQPSTANFQRPLLPLRYPNAVLYRNSSIKSFKNK